ncbi:MAG: hypothetical protein GWN00_16985, partial [Aliifodinibius sp.]|nr:flagellar protein FlgN [candidate division Zixibacteria bacterium]NIT57854.1 flagellar protein FlgN [Fodinibius sp.]NIS46527.1 flagellar protein FlgN [candidate division Zixibacteria bacterium]NIU14644.1 flagellar protein FlgN [candidate division Zixibacteria bacterium]NIV06640.1 hypothetical protein [candidate division Zixibacteria bacterium]
EKILDGEFQALRSLESLIEEEYQCLRTFDSEEQLIEIAEKKQALLTSLEKQAKKRKEAQLSHFTTTKS